MRSFSPFREIYWFNIDISHLVFSLFSLTPQCFWSKRICWCLVEGWCEPQPQKQQRRHCPDEVRRWQPEHSFRTLISSYRVCLIAALSYSSQIIELARMVTNPSLRASLPLVLTSMLLLRRAGLLWCSLLVPVTPILSPFFLTTTPIVSRRTTMVILPSLGMFCPIRDCIRHFSAYSI